MQRLHGIQKLFSLDYQVSEFSRFFSLKLIETGAVTLFDLKYFCNYVYLQEVKTAANKMITQYEKNIEF